MDKFENRELAEKLVQIGLFLSIIGALSFIASLSPEKVNQLKEAISKSKVERGIFVANLTAKEPSV